jgi:hypothetical protein
MSSRASALATALMAGTLRRDSMTARAWRALVCLASVGALVFGLVRQWNVPGWPITQSDFFTYYNAALAVRHGANPFAPVAAWIHSYTPGSPHIANYFVYTPAFAGLLVPFTLLPFPVAYTLWGACNLGFLIGAVFFALDAAGVRPSVYHLLPLAVAASLVSPVRIEYNWGQVDIFLLFLVCAALAARMRNRRLLAGMLLAVACVTKPPLLALVALLLWKREFRLALGTFVSFLGLLLVPFIWLGDQALRDQLTIWQFWSNQYVSFIDNDAPKGVLARLFMLNPYVRPLFVAPTLVTALWLVVVAVVAILTVAVVAPRPLRRDARSLMEIGVTLTAILLISPLTEYIYVILLIQPLLALYLLLRAVDWRSPRYRGVAIGLAALWLLLCLPLQHIEYFLLPRMSTMSFMAHVYVLLAPAYLYVTVALFALQLHALHRVSGLSTRMALRQLIQRASPLARRLRAHVPHSAPVP